MASNISHQWVLSNVLQLVQKANSILLIFILEIGNSIHLKEVLSSILLTIKQGVRTIAVTNMMVVNSTLAVINRTIPLGLLGEVTNIHQVVVTNSIVGETITIIRMMHNMDLINHKILRNIMVLLHHGWLLKGLI